VKNGEILGISGHDGAGKTTILKLIMAMYIPQGGRIVIDNWNIKQLDPLSLRQSIGYSPDNDKIFTGTIRQNILEFNPSLTDDAIHKILIETGLMTYMERLNITIDTVLSYEAIKQLSPSFRKLLSLSRCVARDTSIYLIDEPENHLNYKEINQVKHLISALREREKTVIVVTKSDSILEICDQVLYMNQGRGKLEKGVLYEKQA
jgi:ATP-binding cassette subfamily C protein/ATP-binding cassette subfamily C protein LapB